MASNAAFRLDEPLDAVSIRSIPPGHKLARLTSAAALAPIYAGAFSRPPWGEDAVADAFDTLKQLAEADGIWIQAEFDFGEFSSVIGGALGTPFTARSDLVVASEGLGLEAAAYLAELFVAEGFTSRGTGHRLLTAFEYEASTTGNSHVVCTTHQEAGLPVIGRRLRDLYQRFGYRAACEPLRVPRDPAPRVLLVKHLHHGGS